MVTWLIGIVTRKGFLGSMVVPIQRMIWAPVGSCYFWGIPETSLTYLTTGFLVRINANWSSDCSNKMRRSPNKNNIRRKLHRKLLPWVIGAEAWTVTRREEELLERTGVIMLRCILGASLKDKVKSIVIRKSMRVSFITDKYDRPDWDGTAANNSWNDLNCL